MLFHLSQHVSVTRWAQRTLSAIRPQASAHVYLAFTVVSAPTVCPDTGASHSVNPASVMGTGSTVTFTQAGAWSAETTPQETSVRGTPRVHP